MRKRRESYTFKGRLQIDADTNLIIIQRSFKINEEGRIYLTSLNRTG
jgi:hypothetical protein